LPISVSVPDTDDSLVALEVTASATKRAVGFCATLKKRSPCWRPVSDGDTLIVARSSVIDLARLRGTVERERPAWPGAAARVDVPKCTAR
jgi:hypothetical protein